MAFFLDKPSLHDDKMAVGSSKLKMSQNVLIVPEKERCGAFSESSGKSQGVLLLGWYVSEQHRLVMLW